MRRALTTASAAVLLIVGTHFASAQPKGERVTIKGEVVDLWCYLEGGDRGSAKKACATACAKAGNSIGLLDSKGNLYVTASVQDHVPSRALLLDKMSEVITVTGTVVRNGGVQMLYIESIK